MLQSQLQTLLTYKVFNRYVFTTLISIHTILFYRGILIEQYKYLDIFIVFLLLSNYLNFRAHNDKHHFIR